MLVSIRIDWSLYAPTPARPSEAAFRLDQELNAVDSRVAIQRKGDVDVNDIPGTAASPPEPQPESYVF